MKFLAILKPRPTSDHPTPQAYEAARKWIHARIADHTLDFAYNFIPRGGVCVINAETHEDGMRVLLSYPLAIHFDVEIHPLVDIDKAFEIVIETH